jgi:hypothetical protein
MKRSMVLRCALATGALAGVLLVSACSPASNGAAALAGSTGGAVGGGSPTQANGGTPPSASVQAPSASASGGAPAVAVSPATPQAIGTPKAANTAAVADIYVPLCGPSGQSKKASIEAAALDVSCDSQEIVEQAQWTTWNGSYAAGTGVSVENDCTPSCAAGTTHSYPVTIRLDKPVQATCGEFWSELVLSYQGTPPPGVAYHDGKPESVVSLGSVGPYC